MATQQQIALKENQGRIVNLFNDDRIKSQIATAVPKHITPDRLMRVALVEMNKNPTLGLASPKSFVSAIIQCSSLGLEPGGALGHVYLIPFGNGKDEKGRSNVQVIIGYRGMIDLARRSGQIVSISARAVYENDTFEFEYGLDETIRHKPCTDADKGVLTHVYAVAKLKDGGVQFEVMSVADVKAIQKQSKAGTNGPWVTHFEEMAKKTVVRRLFKYLPVSIEIQKAVGLDEAAERGEQNNVSEYFSDDVIEHDDSNAALEAAMAEPNAYAEAKAGE